MLFCTYVLVVDGHKHINDALHSQHPETKHDQQLEQDVAFRPHVRHQQTHLLPKIFPCRLILIRITQQRLKTCKRCINKINYYYRSKIWEWRWCLTTPCSTSRSSSLTRSMYGRRGKPGALRPNRNSKPELKYRTSQNANSVCRQSIILCTEW